MVESPVRGRGQGHSGPQSWCRGGCELSLGSVRALSSPSRLQGHKVCSKKCRSPPPVAIPTQSSFPESAGSSVFMCCVCLGHCLPCSPFAKNAGKLMFLIGSVEMLKTLSSLALCVVLGNGIGFFSHSLDCIDSTVLIQALFLHFGFDLMPANRPSWKAEGRGVGIGHLSGSSQSYRQAV